MRASDRLREPLFLNQRVFQPLNPIQRAVESILKRWPDMGEVPKERDREEMALQMRACVESWDWRNVKTSRITTAAVAVFDSERCMRPDLAAVRQFYLDEIAARPAGSFLDAMVWVYIDSFRPQAEHSLQLARALMKRTQDFGARIQRFLLTLPRLFNVERAAEEIAQLMIDSDDPYQALKDIGWRAPHGPGLVQYAQSIFVKSIAPKLKQDAEKNRLINWLMPLGISPLETGAGPAIEALLAAWRDETPPDELRHELSEKIVNAYNDPRLHRGGIWAGFDPELRDVLLRWLTKQDMKFFCDMVTATQKSHMWEPRRDFWLELYEDGGIDEAWVAFGNVARQFAQQQLMRTGSTNMNRRFGRQFDRSGSTSLLIMRIGSKIVIDGCHSYRTHIFRMDDPNAPKLYQSHYYCDKIMRRATNSKSHWPIPNWQSWVMQNV